MKDKCASARCRVDTLSQRPESDAALVKIANRINQVTHAATETVELPDNQRITGTQVIERLI